MHKLCEIILALIFGFMLMCLFVEIIIDIIRIAKTERNSELKNDF